MKRENDVKLNYYIQTKNTALYQKSTLKGWWAFRKPTTRIALMSETGPSQPQDFKNTNFTNPSETKRIKIKLKTYTEDMWKRIPSNFNVSYNWLHQESVQNLILGFFCPVRKQLGGRFLFFCFLLIVGLDASFYEKM